MKTLLEALLLVITWLCGAASGVAAVASMRSDMRNDRVQLISVAAVLMICAAIIKFLFQ